MARLKTKAKIVFPNSEIHLSSREVDELRMLLSVCNRTETYPTAEPPVMTEHYRELEDDLSDALSENRREYLGDYPRDDA